MQTGYTPLANSKSDTNTSRQNQFMFELHAYRLVSENDNTLC